VLLGRATKLSDALLNADKKYDAVLKLGSATDSMDLTGRVDETAPVPALTEEFIESTLKGFEGEWMQTPPMYSAKKIKGVRLYELAREDIRIKREPSPVQLYQMSLVDFSADEIRFRVHCSKGTYIRSLADELARRLGTVGHLQELRRTTCGIFTLEEAITLEELGQNLDSRLGEGYQHFLRLLRMETMRPKPMIYKRSEMVV
jgi:tRNA pseudouridine55 synthase